MYTIRQLSRALLDQKIEKLTDGIETADMDVAGKKDIMNLLVKARIEFERQRKQGKGTGAFALDDEAMVDQVVRFECFPFKRHG